MGDTDPHKTARCESQIMWSWKSAPLNKTNIFYDLTRGSPVQILLRFGRVHFSILRRRRISHGSKEASKLEAEFSVAQDVTLSRLVQEITSPNRIWEMTFESWLQHLLLRLR
jgi:hypothetical protein